MDEAAALVQRPRPHQLLERIGLLYSSSYTEKHVCSIGQWRVKLSTSNPTTMVVFLLGCCAAVGDSRTVSRRRPFIACRWRGMSSLIGCQGRIRFVVAITAPRLLGLLPFSIAASGQRCITKSVSDLLSCIAILEPHVAHLFVAELDKPSTWRTISEYLNKRTDEYALIQSCLAL